MKHRIIFIAILLAARGLASYPAHPQDHDRGADGHYHHPYTGEAQPDMCDNSFKNTHPCECNRADMKCEPGHGDNFTPNTKCMTFCRPKACSCANGCGS